MNTDQRPTTAYAFAAEAIDAGWDVLIQHGTDTGENTYVSVEAKRDLRHIRIAWHTRDTGSYRLFSAILGHHDITLKAAREELHREAAA